MPWHCHWSTRRCRRGARGCGRWRRSGWWWILCWREGREIHESSHEELRQRMNIRVREWEPYQWCWEWWDMTEGAGLESDTRRFQRLSPARTWSAEPTGPLSCAWRRTSGLRWRSALQRSEYGHHGVAPRTPEDFNWAFLTKTFLKSFNLLSWF